MKALDVSVCFEEQNIDTAELSGELLVAIFAMMDQRESENISGAGVFNIEWQMELISRPPYPLVTRKIRMAKSSLMKYRQTTYIKFILIF